MQFRVLGPVEVVDAQGHVIDVGGQQPRALLAMLLLAEDRVVTLDTIVERLWVDNPPASASSTLQSYVSRLRRALEPHRASGDGKLLTWESSGYRLHVTADDVDFRRFEQLIAAGRSQLAAHDAAGARDTLTAALSMWHGPALAEFADQPWARGAATRLTERRLTAIEGRVAADLLLGRHDEVIGELSDLVADHPLREGLWEQLAIALYRSGRQADALRAIDALRRQLVDGLGVDPSPGIRELEARILAQDPTLAAPPAGDAGRGDGATDSEANAAAATDPEDVLPRRSAGRNSRHVIGLSATEIVGREAEQETLRTALDMAAQSRTQWVLLEGEPGIGKTRLLEHLADEAVLFGFDVLWGRSYESGAAPAFWPWLPALRGLAEADPGLPVATREVVDRLVSPRADESLDVAVDTGRFRLFEAIALLLERAARRQPLMIALDDLQWADPASLELIEFLTGHVVGSPILVAATVRELEIGRNDAVVQALANVSRRPLTRRLHLTGLERGDSAALVRLATGNDVSPEIAQAIHQRAEGNPFFIGELARLLAVESGLSEAELVRRAGVPAGVRDVIHRRLVRLPAATAELIQMAATLGRDQQLGLLSRAADCTLDRCLDDLEPAMVQRLIVEVPDTPGTVQFAHALIREVVLDDMSMLRRSRLHLRAADAIEASSRQIDDNAEIVAEHLWQAASLGIEERAAAALERAAEVALRRFAYETADGLLDRALQLRRDLPPDRADLEAELDAMNRLTVVRRVRFGFEQARMNTPIQRAKELARRTGRDLVLVELLWTEWSGAATACDLATADRIAREMLEIAERTDDYLIRAAALSSWAIQCWHEGRIGESVDYMDRAIHILDHEADDRPVSPGLIENQLLARGFQAAFHALAGQPMPGGSPLPALAAAQPHPYAQLVVWVTETLRSLTDGDVEAAHRAVTSAMAIDAGAEFAFFRAGAICLLGSVQVADGRPDEGVPTIMAGMAQYQSTSVMTVVSYYLMMAAEGQLAMGEIERAEQTITRAANVIEQTGERWEEPYVWATTAAVRHALGDPDDVVRAMLERAHARAIEQGALGSADRVCERAARLGLPLGG